MSPVIDALPSRKLNYELINEIEGDRTFEDLDQPSFQSDSISSVFPAADFKVKDRKITGT